MSEVSKVTDKIFRERINALIYEVNKIGVNYNQVVAIWQKQAGQVRQDGTPWMDTRAVEIRLTDLMRKTENLRDEFAVIYDLIKKYLAQKKEYNLRSGSRWEESLLSSFGLVTEDGHLTNAGLLFADRCPVAQSRVYCTKWHGTGKTDAVNDSEYQGHLLYLLDMAKSFIKANTAVRWYKLPDYRLNLPEYAERAIEEMCVNHLIHRDYSELGSEVSINIYDDRIETTSPGGITDVFDPVRLEPEKIASKRRNPILAEVFSQLNYMEKRGSGLRKIQDATALLPSYKADKKPFFESSREFFYTTIPNVNYGMTDADFEVLVDQRQSADVKFTQKIHPDPKNFTQKIHPEEGKITTQKKIGKTAQAIIDAIIADATITRKGLADLLGKSEETIKYHLATLRARMIIQHIGPDNGGHWKVLIKK